MEMPTIINNRIPTLLQEWDTADRIEYQRRHKATAPEVYDTKAVHYAARYIFLNSGSSGAFAIDQVDGTVYRIAGAGVANKKQPIGNIRTITGDDLVKLRYVRWSAALKKELGY